MVAKFSESKGYLEKDLWPIFSPLDSKLTMAREYLHQYALIKIVDNFGYQDTSLTGEVYDK